MKYTINSSLVNGRVVELVDTPVLGTGLARGESSSLFSPTNKVSKNADKNDYACVNDMLFLSTKQKRDGVWLLQSRQGGRLRKNHTFHLNNTCDYYSLIATGFIKLTSSTLVRWSCRRLSKTTRRHTPVLVFNKEMFSICPQNNTKHNSSYN